MPGNISVKITADIVELQAQFSVARAESSALTTELNKLARQAATTGMTDELKASLTQAAEAALAAKVRASDLSDELKSKLKPQLDDTGASAKGFGGILDGVLKGAAFLEFEQVARQVFDALKKGFEETIEKAEEFGLSNARMSAMLGMSNQEAAGLSSALKGVGVSSQDYETMAMRMEMRLRTQEAAFKALGMQTRDQSGALLSGQQLMDSAIATMEQFKSGTDQNEFALDVFGRKAAEIYDIMRGGKEEQKEDIAILQSMGVNLDGTGTTSAQLEKALAQLNLEWTGMELAVGQKLMPVVIQFVNWATGAGAPALKDIGQAAGWAAEAFAVLVVGLKELYDQAMAVIEPLDDAFIGLAKIIWDALTGNWAQANADFDQGMANIEASFKKHVWGMASSADEMRTLLATAFAAPTPPKPEANPYRPASGDRQFVDPNQAAKAKRKAAEAARKAAEEAKKAAEEQRKLSDEQASAAEKLALAKVQGEEQADASLLALGKETADQFVEQQTELENRRYAIQIEALQKKAAADANDKLAHQKDLDAIALLEQTHADALARIQDQAAERRVQLSRQETQEYIAEANNRLQNGMAELEQEYRRHELTAGEKARAERQLTTTIFGEELARLDAELSTLAQGTAAWNQAYKQRTKIAEDFEKSVRKINTDLHNEQMQDWKQLGTSIQSTFNDSLNGLILGTMTWQRAMMQEVNAVAEGFLRMGEKIVENWAETQIAKALMTKSTDTASATGQISAAAGVAAANTFAAISAIPVIGPALAPGAAAAAMSEVLGFESLAFAEQGMLLDRDRLVFAHKDEQILPANLSKGMQGLIQAGGAGGGDTHYHNTYAPQIAAPPSFRDQIRQHEADFISMIRAAVRGGSLKAA